MPRSVRTVRISLLTSLVASALAALAVGCGGGGTGPEPAKPQDSLTFLNQVADAPAIANPVDSFWAKRGEDREVRIYYQPRTGENDSSEFLRFRVDAGSLWKRPDGTTFATGDSILITVSVIDAAHFHVEFQPSGLQFSADRPADLRFHFGEASDDINDDGQVDGRDTTLVAQLSLWRQETAGQKWYRVPSAIESDLRNIEASVSGFTHYAIAY